VNGIHDLGGMHGFGPVVREANEPVFHARWEGRVLGLMRATIRQGFYNLDQFRQGIETMDPAHYLRASYYEKWLTSVERNLLASGVLTREELDARTEHYRAHPDAPLPRHDDPELTVRLSARAYAGEPERVELTPQFAPGETVCARNLHPAGHCRLPRYVRGKRGTVVKVHGAYPFPDTRARGLPSPPQPLYAVRFVGHELWGDSAEPNQAVTIDLSEDYLEPA